MDLLHFPLADERRGVNPVPVLGDTRNDVSTGCVGEKRQLVALATRNAAEHLAREQARWLADEGKTQTALVELADALGLEAFTSEALDDPGLNIRFGAWYLGQLLQKYEGHPVLAVSAYNAGPSIVTTWMDVAAGLPTDEFVEEIPYRETREYVRRVLSNLAAYHALYSAQELTIPDRLPTTCLAEPSF